MVATLPVAGKPIVLKPTSHCPECDHLRKKSGTDTDNVVRNEPASFEAGDVGPGTDNNGGNSHGDDNDNSEAANPMHNTATDHNTTTTCNNNTGDKAGDTVDSNTSNKGGFENHASDDTDSKVGNKAGFGCRVAGSDSYNNYDNDIGNDAGNDANGLGDPDGNACREEGSDMPAKHTLSEPMQRLQTWSGFPPGPPLMWPSQARLPQPRPVLRRPLWPKQPLVLPEPPQKRLRPLLQRSVDEIASRTIASDLTAESQLVDVLASCRLLYLRHSAIVNANNCHWDKVWNMTNYMAERLKVEHSEHVSSRAQHTMSHKCTLE